MKKLFVFFAWMSVTAYGFTPSSFYGKALQPHVSAARCDLHLRGVQRPLKRPNHRLQMSMEIKPGDSPQEEIMIRFKRFESLLRALASDETLNIQCARGWDYHPNSNTLDVSVGDLLFLPEKIIVGLAARETGYRLYTRYVDEAMQDTSFKLLFNSIERLRLDKIMAKKYPGYQVLSDSATEFQDFPSDENTPNFEQFCMALLDRKKNPEQSSWVSSADVFESLVHVRSDIEKALQVPGHSTGRSLYDVTEADIQLSASESYQVIKDQIWPVFKKLVDVDLYDHDGGADKTEQQKQSQPNQEGSSSQGGAPGESSAGEDGAATEDQQNAESGDQVSDAQYEQQKVQLEQQMEALANQIGSKLKQSEKGNQAGGVKEQLNKSKGGNIGQGESQGRSESQGENQGESEVQDANDSHDGSESQASKGGKQNHEEKHHNLDEMIQKILESKKDLPSSSRYQQMKSQNRSIIGELTQLAKQIFTDHDSPAYEGYYRSGVFDLSKAMESEFRAKASGTYDDKIFLRKNSPTKKSIAFITLLDRSGSMLGINLSCAKEAAMVIGEMGFELGLDWGLASFDDRVELIKPLSEDRYDHSWQQKFVDTMVRGGTDDFAAIEFADQMLDASDADVKIIFLMTDGVGNDRQYEKVRQLYKDKGYWIIGVGIGADMTSVLDTYERAIVVDQVRDMPKKLAELMLDLLKEITRR